MIQTLSWSGSALRLLDQTRLPSQTTYVELTDEKQVWDAIKRLVVRGAPAIGVTAAFGAYLGVCAVSEDDSQRFLTRLEEVCDHLATSRPTAVNLFWALDRIRRVAREAKRDIRKTILSECLRMIDEDNAVCRAIGEHGASLLAEFVNEKRTINLLTHCNAGALATVQFGTALAPVYVGMDERGMDFHVFVDETRPLLQGSRITAYELQHNGVPATVICDNTAATVMRDSKIDAVIVGADRIAANGDVANKIGTLGVAILARHFKIPFLVAAPISTIDLACASGSDIPIEHRSADEITRPFAGAPTAPDGIDVFNPAFDVTPAELITAIITQRGIARPANSNSLRALAERSAKS
jgi:methylthioribose-1-phosphate isomerase